MRYYAVGFRGFVEIRESLRKLKVIKTQFTKGYVETDMDPNSAHYGQKRKKELKYVAYRVDGGKTVIGLSSHKYYQYCSTPIDYGKVVVLTREQFETILTGEKKRVKIYDPSRSW